MSERTHLDPHDARGATRDTRPVPAWPRPELLAPAGDWDCARAAVENGADAIYFGLESFNARMRARNFTIADLPALMTFLHRRGVRGYASFNTLVFAHELGEAERTLRAIITAGVDAAIVQDVGICRLIRRLSPDFPIHASTQMTITSAAGVEFARELGCSLVVLAREVPLAEIEKIQAAQSSSVTDRPALPLEVFVHGALCVAYSGQCLTSEALGGRSANRGVCAQACRLPYDLIADGQPVPLGDRRYLLSPQDLVGLEVLPHLLRLGIASLKIEGRLKTPEYVANITRVYRQALDRLAGVHAASPMTGSELAAATRLAQEAFAGARYELEMAFSRGLSTGWLRGVNHQELVHGRFGKKRGVYLGAVTHVEHNGVTVRLAGPLKPGDGVVFDAGRPDLEEEGGRVYQIEAVRPGTRAASEAVLRFGRGDIDFGRIRVGQRLWKTSDPELERRLRQSYAGQPPRFQRPLHLEVHGAVGQPLAVVASDDLGYTVSVESTVALAPATKRPLHTDGLREQLGRLGGTPYQLTSLRNALDGAVILPVRELNRLRRAVVQRLDELRSRPLHWNLSAEPAVVAQRGRKLESGNLSPPDAASPELIVLVRSLAQLEAALDVEVRTLYCDFDDPKKYREAVVRFRARSAGGASAIYVAPPRIFKMGEEWILNQVRSCDADGYLVRNYDHLTWFAGCRRVGDLTLNVANRLAAEYFLQRFGLERVTASCDLDPAELEALLRTAPPQWFEIVLHQHMPMFHMEHCVFCAFLTQGTDYRDCGRPCDRHELRLRDRVGAEHPVKADLGCRNTVFNALAQTGAEDAARFLAAGARRFRIEFLDEPPEQVRRTIASYRRLLDGEITGPQLWRELKLVNQLGVTRGRSTPTMPAPGHRGRR